MKEKIIVVLMFTAMVVYLAVGIYQCHKQWQEGITIEEQMREDQLIW